MSSGFEMKVFLFDAMFSALNRNLRALLFFPSKGSFDQIEKYYERYLESVKKKDMWISARQFAGQHSLSSPADQHVTFGDDLELIIQLALFDSSRVVCSVGSVLWLF